MIAHFSTLEDGMQWNDDAAGSQQQHAWLDPLPAAALSADDPFGLLAPAWQPANLEDLPPLERWSSTSHAAAAAPSHTHSATFAAGGDSSFLSPHADSDPDSDTAQAADDEAWMHEEDVQYASPITPSALASQSASLAVTPPLHASPLVSSSATSSSSSPVLPSRSLRPAARACIGCSRVKHRCEDVRPCARCVKAGKPCVDRTDEEIEAAKQARKRARAEANAAQRRTACHEVKRPAAAATTAPVAAAPLFPALSPAATATDRLSVQLFSRSRLAEFVQVGLRDQLLSLHTRLQACPPQVPLLMQFPLHSNMILNCIADSLTPEDFFLFLTHQLTPETVASPIFQSSPLAAWTSLDRRPMKWIFPHSTAPSECAPGALTRTGTEAMSAEAMALEDASAQPQMRMTFLPQAVAAFSRWKSMCRTDPTHIRRASKQFANPLWKQAEALEVSSEEQRTELLSAFARSAAPGADPDSGLERLVRFLSLNHGTHESVSAVELDETHMRHAFWCPAIAGAVERHKRARAGTAAIYQAEEETTCVCARAVPLPGNATVNAAFVKQFGYSQAEVSHLICMEGMSMFVRRLNPPCAWPQLHRNDALLWARRICGMHTILDEIIKKLELASHVPPSSPSNPASPAATVLAAESCFQTSREAPAAASTDLVTSIVRKNGEIVPALFRRLFVDDHRGGSAPHTQLSIQGLLLEWRTTTQDGAGLHAGVLRM